MFTNDVSILSTALSSFNNAALFGPFFFFAGLLCLPIFFLVYFYGRDFVSKMGWNTHNFENQTNLWLSIFLMLWIMLFGGNYAVIRDGISLLPVMISCVLFVLMTIVVQKTVLLGYVEKIKKLKIQWFILLGLLLIAVLTSNISPFDVLLRFSAIICGIIVGSRLQKNISLIPVGTLVLSVILILVLMQPEYFRFGQLANLTLIHLLCLVITGFFAVTALVTKYVKAHSRIHQSAYVKLKWLFRITSLLAFILFLMTESVPVLIGLLASIGLSEALTIYHSDNLQQYLSKQMMAVFIICMGIILVCPIISAIGIVYLTFIPQILKRRDFVSLL